ncbi:HIT family protein [Candidatus Pacearchaeota archaeon CG10_big_fil_rev_8_21_14_0_10_35_13]|nr:MAG: HIT family protein [Candidatus Pacearchaeota archaeon CG10_big_fil_rev_8_21_14_0_10_35_13]
MTNNDGCIFCKISSGKIPASKVLESDNFFVILDISPKITGHSLVISKDHYVNILDLPEVLGGELLKVIKMVSSLRLSEGASGINVVVNNGESAGQVVPHLHIHIIPRWKLEPGKDGELVLEEVMSGK